MTRWSRPARGTRKVERRVEVSRPTTCAKLLANHSHSGCASLSLPLGASTHRGDQSSPILPAQKNVDIFIQQRNLPSKFAKNLPFQLAAKSPMPRRLSHRQQKTCPVAAVSGLMSTLPREELSGAAAPTRYNPPTQMIRDPVEPLRSRGGVSCQRHDSGAITVFTVFGNALGCGCIEGDNEGGDSFIDVLSGDLNREVFSEQIYCGKC
jgi:hypothetical protein